MYYIVLFYTFVISISGTPVNLFRTVTQNGFHGILITVIEFKSEKFHEIILNGNTTLVVSENLPESLYFDPYELENVRLHGGPEFIVTNDVNVELPDYKASRTEAFFYVALNDRTTTLQIPFHARYNAPHDCQSYGHYVNISLQEPKIFTNVPVTSGAGTVRLRCNRSSSASCDWHSVQLEQHTQGGAKTELQIPVGCKEHSWPVVLATAIATIVGCGSILLQIFR